MLEMLVSSKIRRTLLRHLLTHPSRRFYLSGLARELNLTISPLRRELKRFEGLGLLKSLKEANTLFYTVEQPSPVFTQLSQVWGQAIGVSNMMPGKGASVSDRLVDISVSEASPVLVPDAAKPIAGPAEISLQELPQSEKTTGPERDQRPASKTALIPVPLSPAMLPGGVQLPDQGVNERTERTSIPSARATQRIPHSVKRRAVRPRLAFSSTTAMAALSLALMAVVGSGVVTYLVVTHQRVLALTQAASTSSPQLTVVEQGVATTTVGGEDELPIASGKMRSGHWRLSQGAITSFSPSPGKESY